MITIRKIFASLWIAPFPFAVPVSSYAELVTCEGFDYGLGTSRLHQVDGGPVGGFGRADKWTNFVERNFMSNRIFGWSDGVVTGLDPGFPFETTGAYLWSDFGGGDDHTTVISDEDEVPRVRDNTPLADAQRRFMRLRVSLTGNK